MKHPRTNHGMALLILVIILALAATGYMLKSLDSAGLRNERDKKTSEALAEAKAALLGFGGSQDFTNPGLCGTNCPRPGDLPCPDINNDGIAEFSCGSAAGSQQATRLGRLPWLTLGLPDLRDGDGERLWYSVSSRYKQNSRFRPLNSDTTATITLRESNGNIIYDAANNNGLVAVIIAPGASIVRQDNLSQSRDGINQLNASNYLDIAFGEDNQNFVDSGNNGFVTGPVLDVNGQTIVNDRMLVITRDEMNQVMEARVLAEVESAVSNYYTTVGVFSFPSPANFNDITCLGFANINAPSCTEGSLSQGRIPANPITPWGATSVLRGVSNSNWFQLNAWREIIYYATAPACITGTTNCDGAGFLTLNNAQILPIINKQLVIVATGIGIGGQSRVANVNKIVEANYLEGDNLTPLDDIYTRTKPLTSINNDRAMSLP